MNTLVNTYGTLENFISSAEALNIKIKHYEAEGLYCLNYDQINSPKTDNLVRLCRGIIVDSDLNIVCRPFKRFFNYGEALEITQGFEFDTATVQEKADGSLVKVYFWNGLWRIATRGTAFAETQNYTGQMFSDMVLDAFECYSLEDFSETLNNEDLDKSKTYLFEFTSPDNRIVTRYKKSEMVYLGCVNNITGEENISSINFSCLFARNAKQYSFNTFDNMLEVLRELPDLQEGYVCTDGNGLKVKLKSPTYVAVHKIRGECIPTPKRIAELVVTGETDEYLTYFPEDRSLFEPYVEAYNLLLSNMADVYSSVSNIVDQKELALKIKDYIFSCYIFMARKQDKAPSKCFHESKVKTKIKTLLMFKESL